MSVNGVVYQRSIRVSESQQVLRNLQQLCNCAWNTVCVLSPKSPPASMSWVAISTMSTDLPKGLVPMERPVAVPNETGQLEPFQLLP